eukprot:jgi/Chlat1/2684/Chrsp18S02994
MQRQPCPLHQPMKRDNLQMQLSTSPAEHKKLDHEHTLLVNQVKEIEAVIDNIDAQLNAHADEFYRLMGYPLPHLPNADATAGNTGGAADNNEVTGGGASNSKRQKKKPRASNATIQGRRPTIGAKRLPKHARRGRTELQQKPHRNRSGTMALREIRKLVREVCNEQHRDKDPFRFTSDAILAIQEAAETFLVTLLEKA